MLGMIEVGKIIDGVEVVEANESYLKEFSCPHCGSFLRTFYGAWKLVKYIDSCYCFQTTTACQCPICGRHIIDTNQPRYGERYKLLDGMVVERT